jgi:hypothetical protein
MIERRQGRTPDDLVLHTEAVLQVRPVDRGVKIVVRWR